MGRNLIAVLHSLPMGSGVRTLNRVDIARQVLGLDSFSIVNLYPARLPSSGGTSAEPAIWQAGRADIEAEFNREDSADVLLGYGVQSPSGPSRPLYAAQLEWLDDHLSATGLRAWTFGERPSHPSRWQRVAFRHAPGASVSEVAAELLRTNMRHPANHVK